MARNLVWKTWCSDANMLEQALNEMQQSGFSIYALMTIPPTARVLGNFIVIASRFEEELEQDSIDIPVNATAYAAYQALPPAEQQAMQVLLSGMLTRYFQKHEGDPAC